MTWQRPDHTWRGGLFSQQLLSLDDAVPQELVDKAALPALHRMHDSRIAAASRAFHLSCQSVHVIALNGPAISVALSSRSWLSLIYVQSGELELLHHEKPCICSASNWVLMPQCSLIWRSTAFHVICILIPPEEIVFSHQSHDPDGQERAYHTRPPWPRSLCASTPGIEGVATEMLTVLLHSANQLHRLNPNLLERLAFGEQIRRLVAVLIDPEASSPASREATQPAVSPEADNFDALISYIRANLDQPLNLTVLANQSHYSRRALQYAFRNRLGCTATQWIRSQRLDLAWELLQGAGPGDNVTKIAQACGYRSLSLFSIEFQHRFHIKPSVLLRSTRYDKDRQDLQQDEDEKVT